ncbi:MAG TPA: helix-turn-helix domain-containing protein [Steroidobacteraceae bacterium]|jgi:DNA-binding HxlR family transcriptional regulator
MDVEVVFGQLREVLGREPGTELAELVRSMARDGVQREQPMRELFARIGDKWSTLLLHLLRTGDYRHAVLRRLVSTVGAEGRISQRMLTLRLRALERDGLIERRLIPSSHPPGVEYALTPLGRSLTAQIESLMQWIREHMGQILAARAQFSVALERAAAERSRSQW